MRQLTGVDLFAGLGGNTEGARRAGIRILAAANHWPVAVEAHRHNHPEVQHYLQDLQQADFTTWPDFDVLLASPSCAGHSRARGQDKPHHDAARSTAWAAVSCVEAKRPRYLLVENVVDFRDRWSLYPLWRACLERLGYHLSENVLNAADYGVPQERVRLFILGVRQDISSSPLSAPQLQLPHMPASTIINWASGKWSLIDKPGRALATIQRIANGRRRFGRKPFLAPYYGRGSGTTGRSLDRPIGTLTTRDRWLLVDGDWLRMLTARECARGQAFPDSYWLPPQHKLGVFLTGNATAPPVVEAALSALTDHARLAAAS